VVVAAPVAAQDPARSSVWGSSVDLEPVALPRTTRDIRGMVQAGRHIARVARRVAPTAVHCHGMRAFTATLATARRPFVTLHGAGIVPSDPRGYRHLRQAVRIVIPRVARVAISAAPDVPGWRFLPHASPRLASLGRLPFPPAGQTPTFAWVGRVDEGKPGDEFVEALKVEGVEAAVHYPRALNQQPVFAADNVRLPNCEWLARRIISLPVHPSLSQAELDRVVSAVTKVAARMRLRAL